jgi:60 kDa SS-A/Ro ribonucleoprotein
MLPVVLSALGDAERMKAARVHPMAILLALRIYAQGRGDRGGLTWEPVQPVIEALNAAFYTAFRAVEPTGKRLLLSLDVSGSMAAGQVAGSSLTPREASAAMALMTAATEANTHIVGFGGEMVSLPLSPSIAPARSSTKCAGRSRSAWVAAMRSARNTNCSTTSTRGGSPT